MVMARPKTGSKNIGSERGSEFGRLGPGSIGAFRPNTMLNRNDTFHGQRRQTGAISSNMKFVGGYHKNKIEDEFNKFLTV
jgi:hypothetical protein